MKAINIISFDVPYPANYGGVIDVFYKVKAFYEQGIHVHLHCYEYGRGKQKELNKYCVSVTYYKRKTGATSFLSKLPYIVKSRADKALKENLLKNEFPILFEGLHTCFLLSDETFKQRFKIVRNHNVEHHYYKNLAKAEKNDLRKHYFKTEAKRLKQFEPILKFADLSLAISKSDCDYFKSTYPKLNTIYTPAFHQHNKVSIDLNKGNYVLYHGNLSVTENKNAVNFLVKKVFNDLSVSLIIAGLKPDKDIENLIADKPNLSLVENPSDEKLNELIANAQVNLLYTEQATGLKLKLLNVLFNGKHCIANTKMLDGTNLNNCCNIANTSNEYKTIINELMQQEFTKEQTELRQKALTQFNNETNIKALIDNIS
ncbi:MAG: hypothetical protein P1U41_02090 [Vicingaceae bacterium]|nr:hypothetical protein [Vicingaceae bacterium]